MATFQTHEIFRPAFPDQADPPYNRVSHGLAFQHACAEHVHQTFKAERAYIVASTSLSNQTSHVKDLEAALGDRHAGTWIGIRPHTPWEDLVPIINDMRDKKADLLITLGGGSLSDGAKVIVRSSQDELQHTAANKQQVFALAQETPISTIEDLEAFVQTGKSTWMKVSNTHFETLPTFSSPPTDPGPDIKIAIICVPTTLSAGEYTRYGGGTSSITHHKALLTHPKMLPSLVVLDPALTLTTPEQVWLSTGVRAIDHCIESMCYPDRPDEVLKASSKAIPMLIANLLKTKADPNNLEARLQCQIAANICTFQFLYMPKLMLAGASHGIGHQLGPFGVGHGETSCILLPAVLEYNRVVNAKEQAVAKNLIWNSSSFGVKTLLLDAGLDQQASTLGDALDVIFRQFGMPRTLKEVGVEGQEKLDIIAKNSVNDRCTRSNPRAMDKPELVMQVLEMVKG